eukprot:1000781-Pelagomonas_calceolata.AAC.1
MVNHLRCSAVCLVDIKGCEQGLNKPDEAKLLFQVTPLVAEDFESYLVEGVNEARNAFCQGFNCLCGRKAMASVCAGSRVWRTPSSLWRTPCAGSCKDCAKAVRNMNAESAKGYVGYKRGMVAERAQFMGDARGAFLHNFRGKYKEKKKRLRRQRKLSLHELRKERHIGSKKPRVSLTRR